MSMTCPDHGDDDQAALRFAARQTGAALCTIVGIDGSFSRRLGAQLAIGADGTLVGSLSDGCLEHELVRQAQTARDEGAARLLRYGAGSPVIDFRLPCGSGLDVLIDPAPDRAALADVVAALDARAAAVLPLPLPVPRQQPGLLARRHYVPQARLIVLGTGPEAAALTDLAQAQGLAVTGLGPDAGLHLGRAPERLAVDRWTAIVLLFHDHEWEAALLDWALGTEACYIGAQGGEQARRNRNARLAELGHDATALARLRSPIGLIPHARDARTLALSVLADVVATYEDVRRSEGAVAS